MVKEIILSFLVVVLVCLLTFNLSAQPVRWEYSKNARYEAGRWEVVDLAFRATPPKMTNPFDVVFGAEIQGPEKRTVKIMGFYNGNNEWVLRFSSAESGISSFKTFSSIPQLSGLTGNINVDGQRSASSHGAVRVNQDDPRYFVYEDGTPHFMLAFELDWLFALDYGNKTGLPKTNNLLSTIKDNGFNHVVMNVYAYDVGWKIDGNVPSQYYYGKPSYSVFGGSNDTPDFNTLNVQLFQHLDRVIGLMQRLGLDAHLMIYVWNKKVKWPDMYSAADNRYFDYVIRRYQAFSNVIWDVSKEALDYGRCDIPYINERILRIRNQDAFNRLVTVHDYEYNSRESERVDFVSIQSWRSNLYSLMVEARRAHSNKPVVNIEHGGYEKGPYVSFRGGYEIAETCLFRTYECIFAGVYSSYYWQNTAWNIVIHDPLDEKQTFEKPRFDYYKHLQKLFTDYNFNEFRPSYAKITTNSRAGDNNLATNGFALTNDKGVYLMMLPPEIERINVVFQKPASGRFKATWFDPFNGEYKPLGVVEWSGWNEFVKPWQHFAIIVFEGE